MKHPAPFERTSDGRHIIVAGRRWRSTDPNIPEPFRRELVAELMDARRAVKLSQGNPGDMANARARVHNAKVALGERGPKWWDPPSDAEVEARAAAAILALLTKRGPASSICPSDIARICASPDWRPAMAHVRETAAELASQGRIRVTQGDTQLKDPSDAGGPVRYRLRVEARPDPDAKPLG